MRYCSCKVLGWVLLSISLLACAGENEAKLVTPDVFGQCQFSSVETKHLRVEGGDGYFDSPFCSVSLKAKPYPFLEAGAFVHLFSVAKLKKNPEGKGVGFVRMNEGDWHFQGTDLLLDSKMLKTSFIEEHNGDETLLVGQQLIKGNIAQGGPILVPGIRILRITPKFVVSVELNFQPLHYEKQNKGYKQLREAVSRELVDIVKSVQFTPGVPGPTVRSNSAP